MPKSPCPLLLDDAMNRSRPSDVLVIFPSRLGWMALVGAGPALKLLTFGHSSAKKAAAGLARRFEGDVRRGDWNRRLVQRLQAYASGARDDFLDAEVDFGPQTPFQRRVLERCRHIPYGVTVTYGQLAEQAGFPGAARAVGRCMAANPIPLVIPCHRVIGADKGLCGYSGSGGIAMKRRLLVLEAGPLQHA
jgi:methylated-DNA-[protein]-cysteine S-methyltransferase